MSAHIGSNAGFGSDDIDQIVRGYGTIVPTFRLDQLIDGPIDVVKIDVEGTEFRAVIGASSDRSNRDQRGDAQAGLELIDAFVH
jgi:FkbM family methyltransferase